MKLNRNLLIISSKTIDLSEEKKEGKETEKTKQNYTQDRDNKRRIMMSYGELVA